MALHTWCGGDPKRQVTFKCQDLRLTSVARTTFRLDPELLAEAKALAARQHRTLNSIMEEALRRAIAEAESRPIAEPFALHVHVGPAHGLAVDVSIDDNAALLDQMEADLSVQERR